MEINHKERAYQQSSNSFDPKKGRPTEGAMNRRVQLAEKVNQLKDHIALRHLDVFLKGAREFLAKKGQLS